MKHFIILLLIVFTSFSCKKGRADFTIKGTVTNSSANAPLSNANILVYKINAGSTSEFLIKEITTDASGNYSFEIERDEFNELVFKISKQNFFSINESVTFASLTTNEDNTRNFSTTAKGWAKIHLKSNAPTNNLNISRLDGKSNCAECCPGGFQNFQGTFDTTFYCINDGNTNYSFNYFINNGTNTGLKSGITPSSDTILLELIF